MMTMIDGVARICLYIFLLCSFLGPQALYAQVTDFQTFWEATLEKRISPVMDMSLSLEQRFRENSLLYDRTLTTLEAAYSPGKNIGVAAGARWILVKDPRLELENRFRIHAAISYKAGIRSVTLSLRSMFQHGFDEQVLRKIISSQKYMTVTG